MTIAEIKDITTIVGVLIAASSLAIAAFNTRLTLKTNRARFWLDLHDRFASRESYEYRLRNIVANETIRRQKLQCLASGWTRFLALLKRMGIDS